MLWLSAQKYTLLTILKNFSWLRVITGKFGMKKKIGLPCFISVVSQSRWSFTSNLCTYTETSTNLDAVYYITHHTVIIRLLIDCETNKIAMVIVSNCCNACMTCCHRTVFNWMSKNQNQSIHYGWSWTSPTIQWANENSRSRCKAWENMGEQVTNGFGFSCDWSRKWHEVFKPITEHSKAKSKQAQFTSFWHSSKNGSKSWWNIQSLLLDFSWILAF